MFPMNKHESQSCESDHQKKEENDEGEVGKAVVGLPVFFVRVEWQQVSG